MSKHNYSRLNRYQVVNTRTHQQVGTMHTYIVALYICGTKNLFTSGRGDLYTLFKLGKVTLRDTRRTRRDARAHRVTGDA
jgi:hypothetical protein